MWIFNRKRKKKKEEYIYLNPELDIEAEFEKRRETEKNDKVFDEISKLQYVRTQCQLMTESSDYINELKEEYQSVGSHLMDIQVIESQDEQMREKLKNTASEIIKLKEARLKYRNEPLKLPQSQYEMFEKYQDEFPKALMNLQNDEKYSSAVKHDIRVLEAEKVNLKEEIENASMRRTNVRNISIVSLLGIIGVFIIFFVSGQLNSNNGMTLFMVVLLLAAVYTFLMFLILRNSAYRMKIAEKKLARAITLLNSTKIKYVNIVNSVEYQQDKFRVKNSYELSRMYEAYLDDKRKEEKYQNSAKEIDEASYRMAELLAELNLYDAGIWSSQLEAIVEQEAMRQVHKTLKTQHQKLREQIDYNMARIESAKSSVMDMVKKYPNLAGQIMEIVDSYE